MLLLLLLLQPVFLYIRVYLEEAAVGLELFLQTVYLLSQVISLSPRSLQNLLMSYLDLLQRHFLLLQ